MRSWWRWMCDTVTDWWPWLIGHRGPRVPLLEWRITQDLGPPLIREQPPVLPRLKLETLEDEVTFMMNYPFLRDQETKMHNLSFDAKQEKLKNWLTGGGGDEYHRPDFLFQLNPTLIIQSLEEVIQKTQIPAWVREGWDGCPMNRVATLHWILCRSEFLERGTYVTVLGLLQQGQFVMLLIQTGHHFEVSQLLRNQLSLSLRKPLMPPDDPIEVVMISGNFSAPTRYQYPMEW